MHVTADLVLELPTARADRALARGCVRARAVTRPIGVRASRARRDREPAAPAPRRATTPRPSAAAPRAEALLAEPEPAPPSRAGAGARARNRPRAEAAAARLRVQTRPWSKVFVDGRMVGNTPLMGVEISAGRHTLTFVNDDFGIRKTVKVDVEPGQVVTQVLTLDE